MHRVDHCCFVRTPEEQKKKKNNKHIFAILLAN